MFTATTNDVKVTENMQNILLGQGFIRSSVRNVLFLNTDTIGELALKAARSVLPGSIYEVLSSTRFTIKGSFDGVDVVNAASCINAEIYYLLQNEELRNRLCNSSAMRGVNITHDDIENIETALSNPVYSLCNITMLTNDTILVDI